MHNHVALVHRDWCWAGVLGACDSSDEFAGCGPPAVVDGLLRRVTHCRVSWDPAALIEALDQSIAIFTPDGVVVAVNAATEHLYQLPRAHLLGARLWDLYPDTVGNAFHAAFERVAATGEPTTFDHHYPRWDQSLA